MKFLVPILFLFLIATPVFAETNFNCQFLEPVNIGSSTEDFEYSKLECEDLTIEKITDGDNEFYLAKTWNYGEFFIAFLIFLIIIFIIVSSIFNFFFEKMIKIKKKNK